MHRKALGTTVSPPSQYCSLNPAVKAQKPQPRSVPAGCVHVQDNVHRVQTRPLQHGSRKEHLAVRTGCIWGITLTAPLRALWELVCPSEVGSEQW